MSQRERRGVDMFYCFTTVSPDIGAGVMIVDRVLSVHVHCVHLMKTCWQRGIRRNYLIYTYILVDIDTC